MTGALHKRLTAAGVAGILAATLAGCTGDESGGSTVKVGWEVPLSGVYEALGKDMQAGFELYLDKHDGKFGGRKVEVISADEGDGPDVSLPAAERLIKQDEVAVIAGIVNGASYAAVAPLAKENNVPFVGAGGRPELEPEELDGLWHTSWISDEPGEAIAPYMEENIDGSVYAIGPDYQGGYDELRGFTDTFTDIGGELANEGGETTWTKWPDETNFEPYFTEIANSGASAVYAFYAGSQAIDFVTQYAKSDAKDIPLYGAFLTEGSVLEAQGDAAKGVYSVMNYSADLDNAANREFVSAWSAVHDDQTNLYSMAAWDTAAVLDEAIGAIPADQEVTPEAINSAISKLGQIDSPRGSWQFSDKSHAPIQRWYLRRVESDGDQLSNVMITDLATIGE